MPMMKGRTAVSAPSAIPTSAKSEFASASVSRPPFVHRPGRVAETPAARSRPRLFATRSGRARFDRVASQADDACEVGEADGARIVVDDE